MFNDLREYLERVKELGELKVIEDADWDLEIGVISELYGKTLTSPLLLFDKIKDYEPGYRVIANIGASYKRIALSMDLPLEAQGIELIRAWRDKIKEAKLIPPVEVKTGPVKENIQIGNDVNIFKFPIPKWHEFDGGRYVGTGDMVIMRDPDEGWVNLGTYRVQAHDKDIATILIITGNHGDTIRRKYWDRGLSCPAAISIGQEPVLFTASTLKVPWGISEYDYAGGLRNAPVEVVKGEITDLPIPATAEIVLEGEILPPDVETREEGPFGEWSGYYSRGSKPEAIFKVKAVLHRDNPIIWGEPHIPRYADMDRNIRKSAIVWNELDKRVPNIKSVWNYLGRVPNSFLVISLKQSYPGHAKQAAMCAAGISTVALLSKYIIVVDEDIDPSNTSEVLWAMATRRDPQSSIDIIRECWSESIDTTLTPEKIAQGDFSHSMAIILACKPYHRMKEFPRSIYCRPELLAKVNEKWGIIG